MPLQIRAGFVRYGGVSAFRTLHLAGRDVLRPPGRRHADLLTLTRATVAFSKAVIPMVLIALLVVALNAAPEPWLPVAVALSLMTLAAAAAHLVVAHRLLGLRHGPVEIGKPAAMLARLVMLSRIELVLLTLVALTIVARPGA